MTHALHMCDHAKTCVHAINFIYIQFNIYVISEIRKNLWVTTYSKNDLGKKYTREYNNTKKCLENIFKVTF